MVSFLNFTNNCYENTVKLLMISQYNRPLALISHLRSPESGQTKFCHLTRFAAANHDVYKAAIFSDLGKLKKKQSMIN